MGRIFACFVLVDAHTDRARWGGDDLEIVEKLAVLISRPDYLTLQSAPCHLAPNLQFIISQTALHTSLLQIFLHRDVPAPSLIYQLGTVSSCQNIAGCQQNSSALT